MKWPMQQLYETAKFVMAHNNKVGDAYIDVVPYAFKKVKYVIKFIDHGDNILFKLTMK